MSKVAVISSIEVKAGYRERVLSFLLAHGARSLEDEAGTLQFHVLRPYASDSPLVTFEVYEDQAAFQAAFEAHRSGPSITRWRDQTQGMVLRVDVAQFDLADIDT